MMKRLLLLLILLASLPIGVLARSEAIQSFDARYDINQDGTVRVEERITYDFGLAERHGIIRRIPYLKKNNEGKRFILEYRDFRVTDGRGQSYRVEESREDGHTILKIGDPDRTVSGIRTYVISYRVSGALTYFSDHDELYWNVTGNAWEAPIRQIRATVTLPETAEGGGFLRGICFTGPPGSTDHNCSVTREGLRLTFESETVLSSGEGLTMVAGFPKGVVGVLEPEEYTPFWESAAGQVAKITLAFIAIGLMIGWYLAYPLFIVVKWWQQGRDPNPGGGEAKAWFEPPKGSKGQVMLPGEVGTLVDERVHLKDILATVVDLARRGYLKISERQDGDYYLTRTKTDGARLAEHEKILMEGIFSGQKNEVRLKEKKLYGTVEKAGQNLYASMTAAGYFPQNPDKIRNFYRVIVGLALATLNPQLAAVATIFGLNMPKKTEKGVQATWQARSLRNFLVSQERQLKFQAKHYHLFEKLLPYAVAFGVEKVWADRFRDIDLKKPEWYASHRSGSFNSTTLTRGLGQTFSSFQKAATPPTSTTSSRGFSSGFSGGSSGGGGGGGGGSSW